MSHRNAFLASRGRLALAQCVVDHHWTLARAALRFQCSTATAKKWADCYRAGGPEAMQDRSSRPHRSPRRLCQRRERRIIKVRFTRRWGPHRIATHLRLPRSTVEAVLRRYRMPLLRDLDQNTGLVVRRPKPRRYEHAEPGYLIHVDIKKLGRIPEGGGHRKLGRQVGRRNRSGVGYAYLHHAVDDHSRVAYSKILADERKQTAADFWVRARGFFAAHGITVNRVLTDNGSCYRSKVFADALGETVTHKRNNHHRPHTGIKGKTPIERLRVHNLPENYT